MSELARARGHINRSINLSLRKGDEVSSRVHTKLFALVFCTWVEATFSKLIHTPYGFSLDEIHQIKESTNNFGIESGWKKCLELGLNRIANSPRSSYIPNINQRLSRIIDQYVVEPSLIRNKIAHGQWTIALNRDNTALNNDLTTAVQSLDVVQITIWFTVHQYLAKILEFLVESPGRAFHRDYWIEISHLESFLQQSANWSLQDKIVSLRRKPVTIGE